MKYLKLFQTEDEYIAYKNGGDFISPNVSYVIENNIVNYNLLTVEHKSLLKCTFNATEENKLAIANTSNIKSFKVDGNIIPTDRKLTYINNSEIQLNYFPEEDITTINCPDEYFIAPDDLKYIKFMINPETVNEMGTYDKLSNAYADIFLKEASSHEGILINSGNAHDILLGSYNDEAHFNINMVCFTEDFLNIPEGALPPNSKICVLFSLNDEIVNCFRYYYGPTDQLPLVDGYFFDEVGEHSIDMELLDNNIITTRYDHGPIGSTMFYTNDRSSCVTSIELPDNIQNIGGLAFGTCLDLKTVIIPDSVKTIGNYAFFGCSSLTSITIPDSVTSIGNKAFANCSNLVEITCNTIIAPTIQIYTFDDIKEGGVLKVPSGSDYSSWMNYLNTYNWTVQEF